MFTLWIKSRLFPTAMDLCFSGTILLLPHTVRLLPVWLLSAPKFAKFVSALLFAVNCFPLMQSSSLSSAQVRRLLFKVSNVILYRPFVTQVWADASVLSSPLKFFTVYSHCAQCSVRAFHSDIYYTLSAFSALLCPLFACTVSLLLLCHICVYMSVCVHIWSCVSL